MKKIYTTILSLTAIISQAQIPTSALVFRQEFTGNYNDLSTTNAIPSVNTSSLTTDMFNVPNRAATFQSGQSIRYPFSSYSPLMAGSISKEISISCDVKLDSAYFENLPTPTQYVNVLKNGECFIRFRKSGSGPTKILYLQTGIFNNGPLDYGYQLTTYQLKDYTLPTTQDTINYKHNKWNNIGFRYFQSGTSLIPNIETFLNGVLIQGSSELSYTDMPISYNASTEGLVIGQPSGVLHQSFQGKIDNVYIYDRKLTNSEFATISANTFYTGINETKQNVAISIFPNPANSNLTIELSNNDLYDISIINTLGKMVLIQKNVFNSIYLNLSNLANGV